MVFVAFYAILNNAAIAGNISHANVAKYVITLNQLEIYNSTTSEWIVVASTPKSVDISQADAGANIASMVNADVTLPFGTYTQARATVSDTFTIKACSDNGGATCTTATNLSDASLKATATTATEGSVTVNGGSDLLNTRTLTSPFNMTTATTSMLATISFNLDNVFTYSSTGGGYIAPGEPSVTVSIE